MLKSIYSRIFYFSTIVLMFACALTGLVIVLTANRMTEQKARADLDLAARTLLTRIRTVSAEADFIPAAAVKPELEEYSRSSNVDCYIFDSTGNCIIRSDYTDTAVSLNDALRDAADTAPYTKMSGAAGNYSEATATYVERFTLVKDEEPYYLMMISPVTYLSDFLVKLLSTAVIAVLTIGAAGAVLFYYNTSKLLGPVRGITNAAESYAKGDFSVRLKLTGDAEMDDLAATMNRMADFIDRNERSRRSFVSNVSHELKTPMTTIGGFVDGILDGTIPPEDERKYLKTVSSEVKRMTRLVQSMLNISKFEEGSLSPAFQPLDLTELLIKTLFLFEKKIDAKDLEIEGLGACEHITAEADRDLMQQVFYNLIENAIKFVNERGTLTFAVQSTAEEQIEIRIRNSGEGLTEDELSHIFERFYKTDHSRERDTTGVGLGLSIVSRIMVLQNGSVTVKSVYGEYTEFIVSLPLTQPKKPAGDEPADVSGRKEQSR